MPSSWRCMHLWRLSTAKPLTSSLPPTGTAGNVSQPSLQPAIEQYRSILADKQVRWHSNVAGCRWSVQHVYLCVVLDFSPAERCLHVGGLCKPYQKSLACAAPPSNSPPQAEAHERLEQVKAYVVAASRQLEHQRSQVGAYTSWGA